MREAEMAGGHRRGHAFALRMLLMLGVLAYPLAVYFGLRHVRPGWLGAALVALVGARAVLTKDAFRWFALAAAALVASVSLVGDSWVPLKLYPVLVNCVLLAVFATSLLRPPTLIERLARLSDPELSPEAVVYTRNVTRVWCAFFVLNGTISAGTVMWGSDEVWALYNGLLAYALMGILFAAEWCVRRRHLGAAGAGHG